jgi:hypothetical protein
LDGASYPIVGGFSGAEVESKEKIYVGIRL